MKKRTKLSILGIGVLAGALLLTGCTASFCSSDDKAHILYALDYGVCDYYDASDKPEGAIQVFDTNPNLYYVVKVPTDSTSGIGKANADAEKAGLKTPTNNYFIKMDQIVLLDCLSMQNVNKDTATYDDLLKALDNYGYTKFGGDFLWERYDLLNNHITGLAGIPGSGVTIDDLPTNDYIAIYKQDMNTLINNYRSCLSIKDGQYGYYGYPSDSHYRKDIAIKLHNVTEADYDGKMSTDIGAKSWKYAWSKGFFEGLLVYPIGWLTETFVSTFKNAGV